MINRIITGLLVLLAVTIPGCQADEHVDGMTTGDSFEPQQINQIAFSRLTEDYWQIWTMHPESKAQKQMTFSPSDKRYPVWTRDGNILYRNNNGQAFLVDAKTGEETCVLARLGMVGSLAESPNGEDLVVVRYRSELMDSSDLWSTSIEGERQRILTRDIGLQFDPAWSPDGQEIVYVSGQGSQTHEVCIIDSDGKNMRKLTDDKVLKFLPVFSPDGKTIAYVSDITGNYEIWLMNTDGTNKRKITDYVGIDTRPSWSPDGARIVFVSSRNEGQHLWVMDRDGTNTSQLTTGPQCIDPIWRKEMQE